MNLLKRALAEAIGTYVIVFAACGVVIANQASNGAAGLLGIALAPGLAVMAMVTVFGPICGAHFNPAVTVARALVRDFSWRMVPGYLLAQLIGAVLASASHWLLFGSGVADQAHYGAHIPTVGLGAAFGFEVIYAFILMLVIMGVATDSKAPAGSAAPMIGFAVAGLIVLGGPISGASMNPFRSLAPALFAGGAAMQALPVYVFAPLFGMIAAALVYEGLRVRL